MTIKSKLHIWIACAGILSAVLILPNAIAADASQFMVLANEPMEGTYLAAYQEITELLFTDSRLILIAEIPDPSKEKYALKAQIYNSKGDCIYDEQKDAMKRLGKERSYIYHEINLDNELKSKLTPAIVTIRLDINGKPYMAKTLRYYGQSSLQKKIDKFVILPFYSTTNQFFDYKSKDVILGTFSDALKCETQRYFAELVPADISGKSISGVNVKKCFQEENCSGHIKKIFGESIFISGNVILPGSDTTWYAGDREGLLEIHLFNANQNQTMKFRSTFRIRHGDAPVFVMKSLLNDILVKQGLLSYIRSL